MISLIPKLLMLPPPSRSAKAFGIGTLALVLGVAISPATTHATTIEWANVGSTWSTGANWVGNTAPASSTSTDVAAFGSQGGAPVNPNLTATRSINGVNFLAGAYAYTITGSALTIGASGMSNVATNTETFSNGLLTSASQTWTVNTSGVLILNGSVDINGTTTTSRTLTVSSAGTTTFNGVVQNSFAGNLGCNLTLNGSGVINLSNANTYSGVTTIGATLVNANVNGALSTGNVGISASAALTLASSVTNAIGDSATLSLGGTGATAARLNLIATTGTLQETVGGLILNGTAQAPGTYGATGSGAANINDTYFAGGGILTVVPEPGTYAMLATGAAGLLVFRRRRGLRLTLF